MTISKHEIIKNECVLFPFWGPSRHTLARHSQVGTWCNCNDVNMRFISIVSFFGDQVSTAVLWLDSQVGVSCQPTPTGHCTLHCVAPNYNTNTNTNTNTNKYKYKHRALHQITIQIQTQIQTQINTNTIINTGHCTLYCAAPDYNTKKNTNTIQINTNTNTGHCIHTELCCTE